MNVAIIGCNGMGRHHARMAANCGLRIVVCADVQKPIARALADEYGAISTIDCLAATERPDVDIVAVTTRRRRTRCTSSRRRRRANTSFARNRLGVASSSAEKPSAP